MQSWSQLKELNFKFKTGETWSVVIGGAQSRLTLRRAAPLHATCTESLPLFRASGGDKSDAILSLTLLSPSSGIWTVRLARKMQNRVRGRASTAFRSLPTAFGYPGMLRKIGARNMNETARRCGGEGCEQTGDIWIDLAGSFPQPPGRRGGRGAVVSEARSTVQIGNVQWATNVHFPSQFLSRPHCF